jgi:hypothetical protein
VVVSQLFPQTQNFPALVCFFRFFHANLLSGIKFVGWVDWLAGRRATPY